MKVVAILQARMNSTRLPGKSLLPLAGKPMVQHIIERVQRATKIDQVVLAFPSRDINAFIPFTHLASLYGYALDENDLVGRYLSAAEAYDADIIVRIPCDNPCVDPAYIDAAIFEYMRLPYTFYSNTTFIASLPDKKPTKYSSGKSAQWVDGVGAEVFSRSRLQWLDLRTAGDAEMREHPHKYFYALQETYWEHEHDGGVAINMIEPDDCIRLDVNTQADYEFIKGIFDHFGHNHFTTEQVIAYLDGKKHS